MVFPELVVSRVRFRENHERKVEPVALDEGAARAGDDQADDAAVLLGASALDPAVLLQAVEDALSGAEGNPARKAAPTPEIEDDFEDLVGKVAEAANDLRDNDIAVEPAAVRQPPKVAAAPRAPQRPVPQRRIEAGEPLAGEIGGETFAPANDPGRRSVSELIYQMRQQTSNRPFWIAGIVSAACPDPEGTRYDSATWTA